MNNRFFSIKKRFACIMVTAMLASCSNTSTRPQGSKLLRDQLIQLQSDPQLASRAAVAIKDAEAAVKKAEEPQKDQSLSEHLILIAERKIQIAEARAQSRLLEDQRIELSKRRHNVRLESRSFEVETAKAKAAEAEQKMADLQRQIADLNANPTERGMVMTLGDLQFATGKAKLRDNVSGYLSKLARFLKDSREWAILIEGHTDNVGFSQSNILLSQKRAEAVKDYLVNQSVNSNRLDTAGMGASIPIADNNTAIGRQQNRRVEIVFVDKIKEGEK
ncbi:OmpA family protein [Aliikangiella sp. IMCC44359]|uniref:OmpA family protein n=1 Tax=Aliikangiella sp. IMCC44359 TaxID=3459125 RepID=UPI00403AC278